jgi:hypothetical protein
LGTHVTNAVPLSNSFKSIERLKSINIKDGIGPQLSFLVKNVVGLKHNIYKRSRKKKTKAAFTNEEP